MLLGAITPSCSVPRHAGDIGAMLYISFLSEACRLRQPFETSADICSSLRVLLLMERFTQTSGTDPS
jgi:hypothetical protein